MVLVSAALNPKRALRTQSKNWRKSVFVIKTVNKGDGIVKDDINDDDDDDKDGEEPCSVVYSESSPGEIEAASFPRLVEHLTSPSSYGTYCHTCGVCGVCSV
jgi:hypothetical protein